MLDLESAKLWGIYRHIFPGFSQSHIAVYRCLWRIEPRTGEEIIAETGLAKATVFKALSSLVKEGLVKKMRLGKVCYCAPDPLGDYAVLCRGLRSKLESGKETIGSLIKNSSGLGGEVYLVKRDGGQQRLILKGTRETLTDECKLLDLRRAIDSQLRQASEQKAKAWAVCR
ncbi:Sugar-specific transcriptional regulator TrmB [uncultured archaeon]|nr:Sugar-specific transcriptional regulator TrmB [uncultured archaeon]